MLEYVCFHARSGTMGNPEIYSNFLDESINKNLASLGRQGHYNVWQARVHSYFDKVEDKRVQNQNKRARLL